MNSYCSNREGLIQRYKEDMEITWHILEGLKRHVFNFRITDSLNLG